jgi:hypothetical protein
MREMSDDVLLCTNAINQLEAEQPFVRAADTARLLQLSSQ